MASNLKIDDALLDEAVRLTKSRTKRETVNLALERLVSHMRQLEALEAHGTIDFDPEYDYKKQRQRA